MLSIRRHVREQGNSLIFSLPRIWVLARGLKPNDEVEVQLDEDLRIIPIKKQEKKSEAE